MEKRRYSIKFSGVSPSGNDFYHDGKMSVKYCYMFSDKDADTDFVVKSEMGESTPLVNGKLPPSASGSRYSVMFPNYKNIENFEYATPLMLNYTLDTDLDINVYQGLYGLDGGQGNQYSIYRREYEVYQRPGDKIFGYRNESNGKFYEDKRYSKEIVPVVGKYYVDKVTNFMYRYNKNVYQLTDAVKIYKGPWEPVALKTNISYLRDYNITNDRSYQYIMYPAEYSEITLDDRIEVKQIFANYDGPVWASDPDNPGQGKFVEGSYDSAYKYGTPVTTHWEEWSIVELEPVDFDLDIPIAKQTYRANFDQLWLFKYSLETGAQTQNIGRSEFQTLGQFPKVGFGQANYASGDVSALLGSEIIPYKGQRYIERLRSSRLTPLSTNERTTMLQQWKKLVASKNPKLLRDMKGQAWIVQIMSSSNTPKNSYMNQPDTISFSWKQVADTKNVVIYGDVGNTNEVAAESEPEWEPMFRKKIF